MNSFWSNFVSIISLTIFLFQCIQLQFGAIECENVEEKESKRERERKIAIAIAIASETEKEKE